MDETDRIQKLHELIEEIVKLQQESNKLMADLARLIANAQARGGPIDRRKKPRT